MKVPYNPKIRENAQKLRREMTKEECHLWYDFLKSLPVTVNRQKVLGKYIVDFYCASARLVIELDGSQHFEGMGIAADKTRDDYLKSRGFSIKRYSNEDVNKRFESVCSDIYKLVFPTGE